MAPKPPVAVVSHWDGAAGVDIVLALCAQGFRVVANASEEDLLMAGANDQVLSVEFDATFEAAVKEKMAGVIELFGKVDVLVNNPLMWTDAALAEITEAMWAEVLAKNFKSAFYLSRALAPAMTVSGGGRIINVTSTAGLTGAHTPYAVSCAALMSLTRSMAIELAPAVRVNTVAYGFLDEPWIDEAGLRESLVSKVPLGRLCKTSDIAEFVSYLAGGGEYFTGQTFVLDGGEIRH